MTPVPAVTSSPKPITEAAWQSRVVEYAQLRGWLVHHTRPARTTRGWRTPVTGDPGFPDLVLARQGRVIIAELKRDGGRLAPEQCRWLDHLGPAMRWPVMVVVWRPGDWPKVQRILDGEVPE